MMESQHIFEWHELFSPEPEKSAGFYADICTGDIEKMVLSSSNLPYFIVRMSNGGSLGITGLPSESIPMGWYGYIFTEDMNQTLERVKKLGGRIVLPATMEKGIGKYALISDPEGVVLGVDELVPDLRPPKPNIGVSWNELVVRNLESTLKFYQDLFGWKVVDKFPMETGPYLILGTGDDPKTEFGAIYASQETPPTWRYYIHIERMDPVIEKVKEMGGKVTMGPLEVPGGTFVALCLDDQGIPFAIHAPKR